MSSNNLDKYLYLTGEDLGLKLSTVEKAKIEYSPVGMLLSKVFKKNEVKSLAKSTSDFNYDSNHAFGYDEFEEMSLESKYNKMKNFNKLFTNFKNLKTVTQLRKEKIFKNVDNLYRNYYNAKRINKGRI